jgi:MFS family permease
MKLGSFQIHVSAGFKVPRIVRQFIIADLLLVGGWGFVGPVLAVFIMENVRGATLFTVGTAYGIYWLVKSLIQLPIAVYLDDTAGEKDDFTVLLTGLVIAGIAALGFILVDSIWKLYAVQLLHAIAFGMYVPSWSAIFSRHIAKNRYAVSWSLDSTAIGAGAGLAGFLGGAIANQFGFASVFIVAAIFSFAAAIVIFLVPEIVLPKPTADETVLKNHSPNSLL